MFYWSAQEDDYHRFEIDNGLVNDKLRAGAIIWTKQDVLFQEGGCEDARWAE